MCLLYKILFIVFIFIIICGFIVTVNNGRPSDNKNEFANIQDIPMDDIEDDNNK